MARAKFYYNVKTLKYERDRLSIRDILSTTLGLVSFGVIFFVGLFYLQNKLIDSPVERRLRNENKALKQHYKVLSAKLDASNSNLIILTQAEIGLHNTFFDSKPEKEQTTTRSAAILTGELDDFDVVMRGLREQYELSYFKAAISNDHYSRYASISKLDLKQIRAFPGALPIANADAKMLVSGFGTRINPWHKGKFHHDGVDFAAVRGTEVQATGEGTVTLVKNSDLPAGFGSYIEIDHGFGYVTRYTHLGEIKARVGQKVLKGATIALIGMSGGSIAPHVHYEVLKDGHQIDPLKVLVEGLGSDQFHLMANAARQPNQSLD